MAIKSGQGYKASDITEKINNLLINGGFDIDDGRSSIANIVDGVKTMFDNWLFNKAGSTPPTVTLSVETTTKKTNSKQSCRIDITVAGTTTPTCNIKQLLNNFNEFRGLKVSLRLPIHAAIADKVRSYIDDGVTKTYSGYHTGGGTFENLDVENFSVSASATKLEAGLEIIADGTYTVYADNAMLSIGDTSVDYTQYDKLNFLNIGEVKKGVVGFLMDGGGAVLGTGIQGDVIIPYAGRIRKCSLLADQTGSVVVDIWKDTYANFPPTVADTITASAKPTLSAASKYEDATLTGWTTIVAAGDILRFNIDSVATITRLTLILAIEKTIVS